MSTADGGDTAIDLAALIRDELRDVWRYTWMLWFSLRASRAERERWRCLRAYHQGQIERLKKWND